MKSRWLYFYSFIVLSCRNTPEVKDTFIPSFTTYKTDSTGADSAVE